MASMTTMTGRSAAMPTSRTPSARALRAVAARVGRSSGRSALKVAAAVQFDYDTKVFKKELVKFADTEEYIYR